MRKDKTMEEELNKILSNEELDQTARVEAIKAIVGKDYVPVKKHTETVNQLNSIKTEFNQFKETKMTDEEKQAEAIRLEKEKSSKQSKMLSQLIAENVFSKAGFKEDDYKEIIPSILKDEPEETKSLASVICNTMLNQKKVIENQVKEQIIKGQKKPEGGDNPDEGVTQLDKLKTAYAEAEKNGDMVAMASLTMQIAKAQNK